MIAQGFDSLLPTNLKNMNTIIAATEVVIYTPVENFLYNTSAGQTFVGWLLVLGLAFFAGFITFGVVEEKLRRRFMGVSQNYALVIAIFVAVAVGVAVHKFLFF